MKSQFPYIDRKGTDSMKWFPDNMRSIACYVDNSSIPLSVADMDLQTVPSAIKKIHERVEHGIYGYYYINPQFHNSIKYWYNKRYSCEIETDWVILTQRVLSGLAHTIQSLTKEGDEILIQEPVFYQFRNTIELNDRITINNPLIENKGIYSIDFDNLEQLLKKPTITMMIFCSPHNPIARIWTKEELLQVAKLCYDNNVLLCSDEIHGDLVLSDDEFISAGTLPKQYLDNTIIVSSTSKTFNTVGLETAHIIISNPSLRKKVQSHMEKQHVRPMSMLGNAIIPVLYSKDGEEWLDELLPFLRRNLQTIDRFFKQNLPKIKIHNHQGTYLAWIDFRETGLSWTEIERKMNEEAKLVLDPGSRFGESGRGFMRLNMACHVDTIQEALNRIYKTFKDC